MDPFLSTILQSQLKSIYCSFKPGKGSKPIDEVLFDKIITPNELKDSNSQNAVEIFQHLLATKRDAFVFPKDVSVQRRVLSDNSIDHLINLEDPPIDLVFDKSEEETSTEK